MERFLWYKTPASSWTSGLPIGNGRLAAMILNEENMDLLSLNHENLWRGVYKDRKCDVVYEHLDEVRQLILNEEYERATAAANEKLSGRGGMAYKPERIDSYQPAGDLCFKFKDNELKERRLDITDGIAMAERRNTKTYFLAHCEQNLIICHTVGKINCSVSFSRVKDENAKETVLYDINKIYYECEFIGGISYAAEITLETDGKVTKNNDRLCISDATYLDTYVNIGTDVLGKTEELNKYKIPCTVSWEELKLSHTKKFSEYMNRVYLELNTSESLLPTDERIKKFKEDREDDSIIVLFLNYGRYLLIASSVCGIMPANLQGKWNADIEPPWMCDYHFDINVQMCYWLAECGNLSECCNALFDYTDIFLGEQNTAAKNIYNCRGVLLPLSSDCWGISTNEASGWDVWIGAAAWMAQHYKKHYEYNGDKVFLKERAYPFFKKTAEFYEDYLIGDKDGVLQIVPSQSPENSFLENKELPVSLGMSSAMDVQLAYDALTYAYEAADILGVDTELSYRWREMRDRLPEFKTGSDGRLLEWDREMYEREPGHRHLSHLYGIFPGEIFMTDERRELLEAGIKSLNYRLNNGGGHTGWSRAWVACLYTRMGKASDFYNQIINLITDFTTESLLDLHPPGIFQIDGNIGGAEAILQAIVQSYNDRIYLLKALPEKWESGYLKGVKTVGGHNVSVRWKNRLVTEIEICMGFCGKAVFVLPDGEEIEVIGDKDVFNIGGIRVVKRNT